MFTLFSLAGFDTSILPICKDSLGWMFNKLDMNYDLLLDQSELSAIYLDKYELCMRPLFNSCDSFKDGKLSNNEWCYCFQKPEGEREREIRNLLYIIILFIMFMLYLQGREKTAKIRVEL